MQLSLMAGLGFRLDGGNLIDLRCMVGCVGWGGLSVHLLDTLARLNIEDAKR